jgi:L-lactate dehydrogenase complex protein LldG
VSARDRILARVREAIGARERTEHPGAFEAWRPAPYDARVPASAGPLEGLEAMLGAAGGEVVRREGVAAAAGWLADFASGFESAAVGDGVPAELRPPLPEAPPVDAPLAVSMAWGAIAETGSLLLDARDGRRVQLLAPTHVVLVRASDVHATFRDALRKAAPDLPSAIGLHSGPSKSADIGHIMVQGVHGPGRLIAVVIGGPPV